MSASGNFEEHYPTVVMSREELDIMLQIEKNLAGREHTKPTVLMGAITPEMIEQHRLRGK